MKEDDKGHVDPVEQAEINHNKFKDPVGDENFTQKPSLSMRLSIRANVHKFLVIGIIAFFSLLAYSKIPASGLRVYDILGKPAVTKSTSKFWLHMLSHRIEASTMLNPIYLILFICLVMAIYYVIDAKTTEYNVNFRFIEIKQGVFNRKFDTIDLIHVKDQILERPLYFRLLGISRLIILSNDKSTPVLRIAAVNAHMAQLFLDFLRQNAYQNATEYWIAKDRHRRNEKGEDSAAPGGRGDKAYNIDGNGNDDGNNQ